MELPKYDSMRRLLPTPYFTKAHTCYFGMQEVHSLAHSARIQISRRGARPPQHGTLVAACRSHPKILHRAPPEDVAQPVTRRIGLLQRVLVELSLVTKELIVAIFEDHEVAAAQNRGVNADLFT